MNSFIVSGGNQTQRADYMHSLQTSAVETFHIVAPGASIAIAQIHDLASPLSLSARLPRIVWIEQANQLTLPSQNALLKMLEEPPNNTSFYLTLDYHTSLLPTIRSRATVITLDAQVVDQNPAILSDLKLIMGMTSGDRIQNITKRDRAESIIWLTQIEGAISRKIKDPSLSDTSLNILTIIAKCAQQAHLEMLSNCSVSLVTQNFYLLLPHTQSRS